MAKRHHYNLVEWLQDYSSTRALDFHMYSEYHMRMMDGGFVCLDMWTTGKYYFKETNYNEYELDIVERGGEKGELPVKNKKQLFKWLDDVFYPKEIRK